ATGETNVSSAFVEPAEAAFDAPVPGATVVLEATPPVAPAPPASVEWMTDQAERFGLSADGCEIGRDVENDIVIDDPRISRKHAEIRARFGRYVLRDLESTNGTFVNGERVKETVIGDGARIVLGSTELVFRSAE